MSFFVTPTRRAYQVRAFGNFPIALILGVVVIAAHADTLGLILGLIMASGFAVTGGFQLWLASTASPDESVTLIPQMASEPEQVRFFRRSLWTSAIAFPILTGFVAYDLHQLEVGAVKEVRLWAPLIHVYDNFGYWPTLAFLVVLGLACCAVFAWRIRRLTPRSIP